MKNSMGIGLDELLEDVEFAYKEDMNFIINKDGDELKEINISEIEPNPYQPRKTFDQDAMTELANSLQIHGLLQPVVVVKASNFAGSLAMCGEILDTKKAKYFLIAGERRLRAAQLNGWTTIKAIVATIEPVKTQELALIENIHRENLNPIELAMAYESIMLTKNITQDELSQIVQKSRSSISNTIRLLKLSPNTQELIASGKISAGHAKVIAGNLEIEQELVGLIIEQKLNVRDCENYVTKAKQTEKKKNSRNKLIATQLDLRINNLLKTKNVQYKFKNNILSFNLEDSTTLDFIREIFALIKN